MMAGEPSHDPNAARRLVSLPAAVSLGGDHTIEFDWRYSCHNGVLSEVLRSRPCSIPREHHASSVIKGVEMGAEMWPDRRSTIPMNSHVFASRTGRTRDDDYHSTFSSPGFGNSNARFARGSGKQPRCRIGSPQPEATCSARVSRPWIGQRLRMPAVRIDQNFAPFKHPRGLNMKVRFLATAGAHAARVATRAVAQETQRAASTTAPVRLVTRVVIGFNLFFRS
jgi:hypothetical protein